MNTLEDRIAKLKLEWIWTGSAFTAIHKGFGFVIYYRNNNNWLTVLTKKTVEEQLKCHKTEAPRITGFWIGYHGHLTNRMFEIPVTPSFLSHVVESSFPEMLVL